LTTILVVTLMVSTLSAQNVKVVNDLRSRTALGIEYELFDDVELGAEIELGMEEDLAKLGKLHGELVVGYSPWKFIEFQGKYRYTKNRKNYSDEYKYTHSFALASELDKAIDRFKFYYRLQYQNVDEEAIWVDDLDRNEHLFRNRIKVKYNIKGVKFDPFVATELYVPLSGEGLSLTKLKTIVGVEYKVKKVGELKAYYRNDRELTNFIPYSFHTLGVVFVVKL